MLNEVTSFLQGSAVGMIAAASGFASSVVLLWASWRSVRIREALLSVETLKTDDPVLHEAAVTLSRTLNRDQLEMIRGERRLYLVGVFLLAIAFLLSFLREIA